MLRRGWLRYGPRMHLDVVELMAFYRTPLGHLVRHLLRRKVREAWPDVRGMTLVGLGYATPFLRPFLGEAERVGAFMPAGQGVCAWPLEGPRHTTLTEETQLPLQDASIDRLLLVHALENTESVRALLEEVWRVLVGTGEVIIVVPNRRGIWARSEISPFGHGRPFSRGQVERLLRQANLSPGAWSSALQLPPSQSRWFLRAGLAYERVGERWWPGFGGLVIVRASKQVYITRHGEPARARLVQPVRVPQLAGRRAAERAIPG